MCFGGNGTAGVASAIPEHYSMKGLVSGIERGHRGPFSDRRFNLDMYIDSDLFADPRTFQAFLHVDEVGG